MFKFCAGIGGKLYAARVPAIWQMLQTYAKTWKVVDFEANPGFDWLTIVQRSLFYIARFGKTGPVAQMCSLYKSITYKPIAGNCWIVSNTAKCLILLMILFSTFICARKPGYIPNRRNGKGTEPALPITAETLEDLTMKAKYIGQCGYYRVCSDTDYIMTVQRVSDTEWVATRILADDTPIRAFAGTRRNACRYLMAEHTQTIKTDIANGNNDSEPIEDSAMETQTVETTAEQLTIDFVETETDSETVQMFEVFAGDSFAGRVFSNNPGHWQFVDETTNGILSDLEFRIWNTFAQCKSAIVRFLETGKYQSEFEYQETRQIPGNRQSGFSNPIAMVFAGILAIAVTIGFAIVSANGNAFYSTHSADYEPVQTELVDCAELVESETRQIMVCGNN